MATEEFKKHKNISAADKDLVNLATMSKEDYDKKMEAAAMEAKEPKGFAAKMKEALVAGCNKMSQMSSAIKGVKSQGKDQGRGGR